MMVVPVASTESVCCVRLLFPLAPSCWGDSGPCCSWGAVHICHLIPMQRSEDRDDLDAFPVMFWEMFSFRPLFSVSFFCLEQEWKNYFSSIVKDYTVTYNAVIFKTLKFSRHWAKFSRHWAKAVSTGFRGRWGPALLQLNPLYIEALAWHLEKFQ